MKQEDWETKLGELIDEYASNMDGEFGAPSLAREQRPEILEYVRDLLTKQKEEMRTLQASEYVEAVNYGKVAGCISTIADLRKKVKGMKAAQGFGNPKTVPQRMHNANATGYNAALMQVLSLLD